jgi:hypothetical protein
MCRLVRARVPFPVLEEEPLQIALAHAIGADAMEHRQARVVDHMPTVL